MIIFEHIDTKKTVGLNYKVLYSFFYNSNQFKVLKEGGDIEPICIDYFLIRHPVIKTFSFYKNKLYDFYGFEFLSDELIFELSKLIEIDLLPHKIGKLKPSQEIYRKFRSKETFLKFAQNLYKYKDLDKHLYPQSKYLNIVSFKKLIRIEADLNLLKKDFANIDFQLKINASDRNQIIHFLNNNIEQEIYNQYNNDYIVGGYRPPHKGD